MNRRQHFSLLVVRGDGTRVLRFNFPRRFAFAVLGSVCLAVTVVGALVGDYVQLRQLTRDAVRLSQEAAAQRTALEVVNRRVVELGKEVLTWRELHGRIWEAFGPDAGPRPPRTGIGGAPGPPDRAAAAGGDQLSRLTEMVLEEGERLRALDRLVARAGKMLAALPSRWPVRGAVNSEFGMRLSPWSGQKELHGGMDIAAERGSIVRAPATGTVLVAGRHGDFGLTVILDHGRDIRTVYGHLSKVAVAVGQKVDRGTELGLTGNTGRSSGPHLHYEILVKGQAVNPRAYLWD